LVARVIWEIGEGEPLGFQVIVGQIRMSLKDCRMVVRAAAEMVFGDVIQMLFGSIERAG
jgi:hypothetical protein